MSVEITPAVKAINPTAPKTIPRQADNAKLSPMLANKNRSANFRQMGTLAAMTISSVNDARANVVAKKSICIHSLGATLS